MPEKFERLQAKNPKHCFISKLFKLTMYWSTASIKCCLELASIFEYSKTSTRPAKVFQNYFHMLKSGIYPVGIVPKYLISQKCLRLTVLTRLASIVINVPHRPLPLLKIRLSFGLELASFWPFSHLNIVFVKSTSLYL